MRFVKQVRCNFTAGGGQNASIVVLVHSGNNNRNASLARNLAAAGNNVYTPHYDTSDWLSSLQDLSSVIFGLGYSGLTVVCNSGYHGLFLATQEMYKNLKIVCLCPVVCSLKRLQMLDDQQQSLIASFEHSFFKDQEYRISCSEVAAKTLVISSITDKLCPVFLIMLLSTTSHLFTESHEELTEKTPEHVILTIVNFIASGSD
jgi:hypothetical protein